MAHLAKLSSTNIVEAVIVVADAKTGGGNLDTESVGISFCQNHWNATYGESDTIWKQPSYNKNFRGNYAGIGATYMTGVRTLGVASTDVFIKQQPYPSWTIGINTATWYAPIPKPGLTTSQMLARQDYTWQEDAYQSDNTTGWALTAVGGSR